MSGATTDPAPNDDEFRRGLLAGLAAYFLWGLVPIFFHALGSVPAMEVIAHRILWSCLFLAPLLAWQGGFAQVAHVLCAPRRIARVSLGAGLLMVNWLVFVWAIGHDRILETSLGFFINPLLNVALGTLVLGERLRPQQWLAVAIASIGIANEAWALGQLPWVALVLPATFAVYGLLRKQLPMDAASGLFTETLLTLPLALAWLAWSELTGQGHFGPGSESPMTIRWLLMAAGPVTAVPLLLFAIGARRIPLSTNGFLQYLSPSISFLLAILYYQEPLSHSRLVSFVIIWVGLALYTADLVRRYRQR